MAHGWYYSGDGRRHGPVTSAALKSLADAGRLRPTDLVWREGLGGWVEARTVKDLFAGRAAFQIPMPPPLLGPPQVAAPGPPPRPPDRRNRVPLILGATGAAVAVPLLCAGLALNGLLDEGVAAGGGPGGADGGGGVRPAEGAKLRAFRAVVEKYHDSPDEFASDKARYEFNAELGKLQRTFEDIEFDPTTHPDEARAICELYGNEIEGRYSGDIPNDLRTEIADIRLKLRLRDR